MCKLAVLHFSGSLSYDYCSDKLNGLDYASVKKFGYSVALLEATKFWERLDAKAKAKGKG